MYSICLGLWVCVVKGLGEIELIKRKQSFPVNAHCKTVHCMWK